MVEQVTFKNFRALRDATVSLSKFTLIVGPNASGKTSILEGLHYLAQIAGKPPETLFRGAQHPDRLRTSGVADPILLRISGTWDGTRCVLQVSSAYAGENWNHSVDGYRGKRPISFERKRSLPGEQLEYAGKTRDDAFLKVVRSAVLLHLDPNRLAEPAYSEHITPRVEFDGTNLATVLADMAIAVPQQYQEVIERLREIVPPVKSLRLQKTRIENQEWEEVKRDGETLYREVKTRSLGYEIILDFLTGDDLIAAQASEGTLLTLGLLTVLSSPSHPRLVLIDEFERGLHPKALGELVRKVREIQCRFPEVQIVATTHSPYLVDYFDASEVVLTALRDDGSVAVGTLDKHPEFERWKAEMKPGEFWSTVGEDWLHDSKAPES